MAEKNGAVKAEAVKAAYPARCPKCGATVFRKVQVGNVVDGKFVTTATDAVCTTCGTVVDANGA